MARPKHKCTVAGCSRDHFGLGYCASHYKRFKLYGDPLAGRTEKGAALAWLRQHVRHEGDECLLWPFPSKHRGYGITRFRGRSRAASNIMCILAHGEPVGAAIEAAHSCGNPSCCNPNHLRWATRTENEHDRFAHGTSNRGERNGMSKITSEVAAVIRSLRGRLPQKQVAAQFGIAISTVSQIQSGKRWAA